MRKIRGVIITGLSGSGKSTAIKALEDIGYFCVDNLPAPLLPTFIDLCEHSTKWEIIRIAIGMDIRGREFLTEYPMILEEIKKKGYNLEILFLDASDQVLVRRYSETRRDHPLKEDSIFEGITLERKRLAPLKDIATSIIDTSFLNVHQLREIIFEQFVEATNPFKMSINLISFGYRYGIPSNADLIMDVRFLPNPHFIEELREKTGNSREVSRYVLTKEEAKEFLIRLKDMLSFLIPLYEREGKASLTIAIGCTGGRHRSVVITNYVKKFLSKRNGYPLKVIHRDMKKE